jgi:hypothetical protein
VSSCRHDPVRALVPVLTAIPGQGIPLGDVLADPGYAHRDADVWALPLRAVGARYVRNVCYCVKSLRQTCLLFDAIGGVDSNEACIFRGYGSNICIGIFHSILLLSEFTRRSRLSLENSLPTCTS